MLISRCPFEELEPEPFSATQGLRAKYPIRTCTFQSRVYEYDDPEVNSTGILMPVPLHTRHVSDLQ